MTATTVTGRGSARPGRLARSLRGAGLSGAAVAGAGAAGALVSVRAAYPRPPRAAPPEGRPPPRPVPQDPLTVAVVLGASGSVITDALGPYEVFARCSGFFVYTVSAGPAAVLSGGLAVVPDYSLGDVDAGTAPEPAVVVIPAVVSPAGSKERPLRVAGPPGRPGRAPARCVRRVTAAGCRGPARRPPGHLPLVQAQGPAAQPPAGGLGARPALRPGRQDHHHRRGDLGRVRRPAAGPAARRRRRGAAGGPRAGLPGLVAGWPHRHPRPAAGAA
jgi:hypothetical protein